jgi:diketogulonate reductase-like aldo/keto reductase
MTGHPQVLVRWNLQLNNVVVSRWSKPERVAENLNVFDFALELEQMEAIEALHDGTRVLHDGTRVLHDPLVFSGT